MQRRHESNYIILLVVFLSYINFKNFLGCLKENNHDHFPCKAFSKVYLECRMERNLMAKESMDTLGLGEQANYVRADKPDEKQKDFIAGLNVKGSNKRWF